MDQNEAARIFAAMMSAALRSKVVSDPAEAQREQKEADALARQLLSTGVPPSTLVVQAAASGMAMFAGLASRGGLDPIEVAFAVEADVMLRQGRDNDV